MFGAENKTSSNTEVKLPWYLTLFFWVIGWTFRIFILPKLERYDRIHRQTKNKVKYFNPIITESFWGRSIKWVGRDKPLTDSELDLLWNEK